MCKESKVALLLGKSVERISDTVVEEVGECIMYWTGKWWGREGLICLWIANRRILAPPLPPMKTGHSACTIIIIFS